jgi:hypothetical protein
MVGQDRYALFCGAGLADFRAQYLAIAVRSCGVSSYFGFAVFGSGFFVVISGHPRWL